ncbi:MULTISPECIES: DUF3592 domain-containing protein [unclassified Photobacterium]|uniref:DUF3592 domain-containing protein n=1 Tax=unclassified Photobacterium TaxID=2628852 RepID=UPI000D15F314|nr:MULTISPECIES: DUF3592 domain-containing protein [unclassified Photobacterium]PSV25478.1 hypothetical protein C9J42_15895 [Photobacterium sp. GB-56]PSV30017.1 hypothetical protein C9J40_13725 [Photobacterium sp. GB-72]PSV37999.1 hypothetical protein C9J38_09165 [Photobacterium sp. GB-210]PSV38208.1 hypothetical protein C9J44_04005 [Photobacterium sp. GB-27]PSV41774.1 hypothetical protein C9J46_16210 [Photobacterium sp. GB-36]
MNIVPLFAAILFSVLGVYICYDYRRFNKNAIKTQGKIISYDEYFSKDNDNLKRKMYRPYFEVTVNKQTYSVKSKTSFHSKVIPIGQYTDVLYQKGDEKNARIANSNGVGLGFLFIGLSIPAYYFGLFHEL